MIDSPRAVVLLAIAAILLAVGMGCYIGYLTTPGWGAAVAAIFLWTNFIVAGWAAEDAVVPVAEADRKGSGIHVTRTCPCADCKEHRRAMYFDSAPAYNSGHPEPTKDERKEYLEQIAIIDGYQRPPTEFGGGLHPPLSALGKLFPRTEKES